MNKKHICLKNIIKSFIFIGFVFVIFIIAGCSSTKIEAVKAPRWIEASRTVYSDSDYLTYVGNGPDKKSAEVSALSGISAIFGQDVIVNTTGSRRMSEAIANGTVASGEEREYSQDVLSKVNIENLIGVEIKDYWFDGVNTWYGIAVLDRKQACEIYSNMIKKNIGAINDLVSSANKDFYSLQSMRAYDFAQEIAIKNNEYLNRLYVINHDFAKVISSDVIAPEKLAEKKVEIAGEIPVNINIKGDTKGTYTSALLDALADFGFSGSVDNNVRYVIEGNVSYNYEVTSDGKTHKCNYDFESSFIDKKTNVNIFPLNIRGRQAHRSVEEAENRVKHDILKKIEENFQNEFNNYLGSYSVE